MIMQHQIETDAQLIKANAKFESEISQLSEKFKNSLDLASEDIYQNLRAI